MNTLASSKRRFKCPVCDRTVDRKSRQQIFCSTRCRNKAHKTPWALKTPVRYPCSAEGMDPPKITNENNTLQWPKLWSSPRNKGGIYGPHRAIEIEVVAGREWIEEISADGVTSYISRLAKPALMGSAA